MGTTRRGFIGLLVSVGVASFVEIGLPGVAKPKTIPKNNRIVLPGEEKLIRLKPMGGFRPRRIVIPTLIATGFSILDFKVDSENQFTSDNIPAELFSEVSYPVNLDLPRTKEEFSVLIKNEKDEPKEFRMVVIGTIPDGRQYVIGF